MVEHVMVEHMVEQLSAFWDFSKEAASVRKEKCKEALKNWNDGNISYL